MKNKKDRLYSVIIEAVNDADKSDRGVIIVWSDKGLYSNFKGICNHELKDVLDYIYNQAIKEESVIVHKEDEEERKKLTN